MFWQRSIVQITTILGITLLTIPSIAKIDSTFSPTLNSTISRHSTLIAKENQKRVALVIGNSNYRQKDSLKNPLNDANDMAAALSELGFEVIKVVDADLKAMNEALEQFAKELDKGGVGLFYYAGHGIQVGGENYLVPIDAKLEYEKDIQYEALPITKVQNRMEYAQTDVNIIISQ
jgi:uncharacterized caspase-like protein